MIKSIKKTLSKMDKVEEVVDAKNVEEVVDAKNVEKVVNAKNVEEIVNAKNVEEVVDAKNVKEVVDAKNVKEVVDQKLVDEILLRIRDVFRSTRFRFNFDDYNTTDKQDLDEYIDIIVEVLEDFSLSLEDFSEKLENHYCCKRHRQRRKVIFRKIPKPFSVKCRIIYRKCFCTPRGEPIRECMACKCNCRHAYRQISRFLNKK